MTKTITCTDIDGKKFEVAIKDLIWRPSAYGIVIREGKILLSKQFGDRYDLPGGGVDLGESPEEGVIREIKEETGIDAIKPKLVGTENSFFQSSHSKENKSYQCILMYFVCEYAGGELSVDVFDEDEQEYAELAEWIPIAGIDGLNLASTVDYRKYLNAYTKSVSYKLSQ